MLKNTTYNQLINNIDFINKRIDEQNDYLFNLNVRRQNLTFERYVELFKSASDQLQYFENLKKNYYGTIHNTNNDIKYHWSNISTS